MKKILFTISVFVILHTCMIAQNDIKVNPSNPTAIKNQKSIRDLKLIKVMEIIDGQEGCFFKKPQFIKIATNGDVFVYDNNHLYQFDSKGKFIRDLIVKGEGPGELNYFSNFILTDKTVIIGGVMPTKIIIKNISTGLLISDLKLSKSNTFSSLLKIIKDNFYFTYPDIDFQKMKTGVQNKTNKFILVDPKGDIKEQKLSFKTKDALIKNVSKNGVSISMNTITQLQTCFTSDNTLYLSHTERYMIKQVDLLNQKVIRKFKRAYKPVTYIKPKKDKDSKFKDPSSLYNRKYFNDILLLRAYKDKILVFTSTIDSKRGILIDVYNKNGDYIDRFYLNLPGLDRHEKLSRRSLVFKEGYLWTSFMDEDDNPVIAKYKIGNL